VRRILLIEVPASLRVVIAKLLGLVSAANSLGKYFSACALTAAALSRPATAGVLPTVVVKCENGDDILKSVRGRGGPVSGGFVVCCVKVEVEVAR
jgi:hypothetical protein